MAANAFDSEIRKYLPLLGNEEKKSLLTLIRTFLHIEEKGVKQDPKKNDAPLIDYSKYHFAVSDIKFNRDEINER